MLCFWLQPLIFSYHPMTPLFTRLVEGSYLPLWHYIDFHCHLRICFKTSSKWLLTSTSLTSSEDDIMACWCWCFFGFFILIHPCTDLLPSEADTADTCWVHLKYILWADLVPCSHRSKVQPSSSEALHSLPIKCWHSWSVCMPVAPELSAAVHIQSLR